MVSVNDDGAAGAAFVAVPSGGVGDEVSAGGGVLSEGEGAGGKSADPESLVCAHMSGAARKVARQTMSGKEVVFMGLKDETAMDRVG